MRLKWTPESTLGSGVQEGTRDIHPRTIMTLSFAPEKIEHWPIDRKREADPLLPRLK
jgi:hypothetical protein